MISDALRVAIEALHQAIADEPDPEDKATLTQCLQHAMKVQAKNMVEAQAAGRRSVVMSRLGGI